MLVQIAERGNRGTQDGRDGKSCLKLTQRLGRCAKSVMELRDVTTRVVRQLDASSRAQVSPDRRLFMDFLSQANIVLLGDPGSGKTYLFREAARLEGARYLTARAFLNIPASQLRGQLLYVDGLDEKRSGRSDRDTVDILTQRLFEVSPAKVRISCRVADWLGESDLATLGAYFDQSGETAVVVLEALKQEEQKDVLASHNVPQNDAVEFLREAERRGLGDLLKNPQNLLMLWGAVQAGAWPRTRADLFNISTKLMLEEADRDRARGGGGAYSVEELLPAAGAICALRLISDVEGVSLTNQERVGDVPGYKSLALLPPELILSALSRRVFVATSEAETVDYAHRTTAEYLAAGYLAAVVRAGLPFRRLISLIGVDGHPTSELRGLNAWLSIHLPEHAERLIEADPYGVLTYGDAASLSRSNCASLVRALGMLSRENPWFRSENRQTSALGALARADMMEELRAVLRDRDAGFGIRSVVIDALWLGNPLPELIPELSEALARNECFYVERSHALLALLRMGASGKGAVVEAFNAGLGKDTNGIRLRAEVIGLLDEGDYGAADVIRLMDDTFKLDQKPALGLFWTLAQSLPASMLPDILDGISVPKHEGGYDKRRTEVGLFYSRILARAWPNAQPVDAPRMLGWLKKHHSLNEALGQDRGSALRKAMSAAPERLLAVAESLISSIADEQQPLFTLSRFRELIYPELSAEELFGVVVKCLNAADDGSVRQKILYEIAFSLMYRGRGPFARAQFEMLCAYTESRPFLQAVWGEWTASRLPENYFDRLRKRDAEIFEREKLQRQFDEEAERIRAGLHLGWIGHLAKVYFALYSDVDTKASPRGRLAQRIGESRVETAIEGFRATLARRDIPTLTDVIRLVAERSYYDWWYGLVAGLDEHWALKQDFASLTAEHLQALVAFDTTNPTSVITERTEGRLEHAWKVELQRQRPELVRDVYIAIVRIRLSKRESYAEGLHELLHEEAFARDRGAIAVDLLQEFPNATPFQLGELIDSAVSESEVRSRLLKLAEGVHSGRIAVEEEQCDIWLAAAYFLSPDHYRVDVEARVRIKGAFVFALRNRGRVALRVLPEGSSATLATLRFIAELVGQAYPDTPFPDDGWSGDANSWDASEYFREVVNLISAIPTQDATQALVEISASPALASYRAHVLYALANQRQRRRAAEYEQPDWWSTVRALQNGPPATVGDLHALVVEQLLDIALRIRRENTDRFKQFWNVDSHGRVIEPRPEEICRDVLVDFMRPLLLPKGVTVEPEGHMVVDRRADILVAMTGRKVLCELKRDYHVDVWTAVQEQLERFYVHDPEAKGYGVFGVFWFGENRPIRIPLPPGGRNRPASADDMQAMLSDLLPENMKCRIAVVVFDVSGEI